MLTIGVLGAAGIAPKALINPAKRRDDVTVSAIASRSLTSAQAYAAEHGIGKAYGSYEELLADPEVDLVYVALPPSGHAEWSIKALEAGKHVLCEKPFAMNSEQARSMNAAASASGRRLIEAFHDWYHPLEIYLAELVSSGRLGEIRTLDADFSANNPFNPTSIRHVPELGGGALMDLGCYPVRWLRGFMAAEPAVVSAHAETNELGADMSIEATLQFGAATATLRCSMASQALVQRIEIIGSLASVTATGLVFPAKGHSIVETTDGLDRFSTVAGEESYDHQLAAVVAGLASGTPLPTEGADPIGNMETIDAIYAAAGFDRTRF